MSMAENIPHKWSLSYGLSVVIYIQNTGSSRSPVQRPSGSESDDSKQVLRGPRNYKL